MSRVETLLLCALFVSSLLIEVRLPLAGFSAANLAMPLLAVALAWSRRDSIAAASAHHRGLLAAALAVYVWTWISAAAGVDPALSARFAFKYGAYLVVFVCLLFFLHRRGTTADAQPVAYYFLVVLGALGIVEHWFPHSSVLGFFRHQSAAHPRVSSLMIWPNQFGVLMGIAIALGAALAQQRRISSAVFYAATPLLLLALVLTGSRNGWIVFVVLLAILAAAHVITARRTATTIGLFAFALVSFSIPTAQLGLAGIAGLPLERLITSRSNAGSEGETTLSWSSTPQQAMISRLSLWRAATEEIRHHPVSGIGLEAFANTIGPEITGQHWINTHNLLLNVATELGLIGLGLVLVFLWRLVRAGDPACWATSIPLLGIGVGQIVDCFIYDHTFMAFAAFFAASYASRTRDGK